jgi:serine phosphatase RsbU (regulator of sigma subunit)
MNPGTPPPVLVVDDSALTRAWIERVVAESGLATRTATGAAAAAVAEESEATAIVLTEQRLPDGGCALARRLRAAGITAGILVVGDPDDSHLETDARESGADAVLCWPSSAAQLAQAVHATAALGDGRRVRHERAARLDGEMHAAAMIQSALLPVRPELPAGWALESAFLPASDVGGDMVDFVTDGPRRLAIVLADVSGKGVGAALLAAMAQTAIRGALLRGANPAEALADANALLLETLDRSGRFLTGFVASIDLDTGELAYADAGHGHVALRDPDGGWLAIDAGGLPLGLAADADYPLGRAHCRRGGLLAAFSDGLVEGVDLDPQAVRERLLASLADGASAAQLVAEAPAEDDRTLVVLGRTG